MAAVVDTLGTSGSFTDPLWRVTVTLTRLEQDLLRCWWVRRLGFIAHAGAASVTTTQSYSRLEHSLGLLALVAHFDPDDHLARAAALLHDIGHLPFSHTFEGVAGLNHHQLGIERIGQLAPVLRRHGIDADVVIGVEQGQRPSVLHNSIGALRLDHLESFVRSGQSHGRTRESPALTLARLRVLDGSVDTDADTAAYLVGLVLDEARSQCSSPNVVATGLMRHLADLALSDMSPARQAQVAAMTDDEFWMVLRSDPRTVALADDLRRDPAVWRAIESPPDQLRDGATDIDYTVTRFYVDHPLVNGHSPPQNRLALAELPTAPQRWLLHRAEPGST